MKSVSISSYKKILKINKYLNKLYKFVIRYITINDNADVDLDEKIKLIDQNLLKELNNIVMMIELENSVVSENQIALWYDEFIVKINKNDPSFYSKTRKIS